MSKILTRYIVKNFLIQFLIVFVGFFIVVSILESMEIIRRYFSNSVDISMRDLLRLICFHSVVTVNSFFSFLVLLSGIITLSVLHSRLELTVMKTIGFSVKKLLCALLIGCAILSLGYITVFDYISSYSVGKIKRIDTNVKQKTRGIDKSLTITNLGVWFKDVNDRNSYIISAKTFDNKLSSVYNIRIFEFNKNNVLNRTIHSEEAKINKGDWKLINCHIFDINGNEEFQAAMNLPLNLSLSQITKMVMLPSSVSFWSIGKYSNMLSRVGLSTIKYKVYWYSKLSSIVQMFSFIILALALCLNYNSRNPSQYALKIALLLIFVFPVYFLNNVLIAFGESGAIPISLAAFSMPISILVIGLLALERR